MALADIFNSFRSPTPPPAPNQPVPNQPVATPAAAANGVVPPPNGTNANPQQQAQEPKPLEAFNDLWKAPEVDPNAPDPNAPIFNMDPAKLAESAAKMDFSKFIKAETLQKITAGGEEASAAFAQAMNDISRATTVQNMQLTAGMIEKALEKQSEKFSAALPEIIRTHQARSNLAEINPAFNTPALKPMVESLQAQMQLKNPNASPKEINGLVNQYMEQMASFFVKKPEETTVNGSKEEMDWTKFIT